MKNQKKETYEIIDYENVVNEADFEKLEQYIEDVDRFRYEIIKTIVAITESYEQEIIGRPAVLSALQKIKKKLKSKIAIVEAEIPDVANVNFSLYGTLKDGRKILVSKDFDCTSQIGVNREEWKRWYKEQLSTETTLSLGGLLNEIEDLISQVELLETYPDVKQWFPSFDKPGSNRDKLSKAGMWMSPIVKKVAELDFPSPEDITELLKEEYPGFELEYPVTKGNFSKGRQIKKAPIAEALKFIYEKKYPGESITADAIIKWYNRRGYW